MFINKSYRIIAVIVIMLSAMPIKALTPEELANYQAIKSALKARDYNQNPVQIAADIACIEKHIKEQEELKNNWQMSVAPFFFKLFGGGFGLTAGVGATFTAVGTVGGIGMFGASAYKDILYVTYSRVIPEKLGLVKRDETWWTDAGSKVREKLVPEPLIKESEEFFLLSVTAPMIGTASVISAGISRYLLNKAARYKNEIERLEKEIEEDRIYVEELKTKLPAKDTL